MSNSKKTNPIQPVFKFTDAKHVQELLPTFKPFYSTDYGSAYNADSRRILKNIPDKSVNLVSSPPYALHFKKEYGNVEKSDYVDWFLSFAHEIYRVLADDGSFVLNIGGSYNQGFPTRSIYHFKLLIALVDKVGFHLAQECFWYNPAKMAAPAEWVTVRRNRIRDSVEYVWWLSRTPWPKSDNRRVLKPYSRDMIRLNQRGVRPTTRPSGYNIKSSFDTIEAGGSIPPNVIEIENEVAPDMLKFGNNTFNDTYTRLCKEEGIKIHRRDSRLHCRAFFIKMLTNEDDVVVDPFAGSNTTGAVAENLQRRWIAMESVEAYLKGSQFRFIDS